MTDFNQLLAQAGPLCVLLTVLFVNILILGIALRTACSIFNALAGGRDSAEAVPLPSLLGSMLMVVLTHLITGALAIGVIWGATALASSINLSPAEATYYGYLASIPLSFVVLTVLLAIFLPAPVFRAFLISLLYLICAVVLVVLVTVLLIALAMVLGPSLPAFRQFPGVNWWGKGQ